MKDANSHHIRLYLASDDQTFIALLRQPGGYYLTSENLSLDDYAEKYVYELDGNPVGFLLLEMDARISQIIIYVAPAFRRQGIGSLLLQYGKTCLEKLDPNTTWVFFRSDIGSAKEFYVKRGAQNWYSYHFMECEAKPATTQQPELSFDRVITYATAQLENPEIFTEYLEKRAAAFLVTNKMIDSRPYDERERSTAIETWCYKYKEDLWLFYHQDRLIGSVCISEGFFDEVFVETSQQGKNMGSEIVRWGLQKCQEKGWKPSLCVVDGNIPATKCYLKAGFEIKQTLEMMRMFNDHKEPDFRGPIGR